MEDDAAGWAGVEYRAGRGRIAETGDLWLPEGGLAAEATLTLADLPDQLHGQNSLDELGWLVYE